jgi:hypothetical protein
MRRPLQLPSLSRIRCAGMVPGPTVPVPNQYRLRDRSHLRDQNRHRLRSHEPPCSRSDESPPCQVWHGPPNLARAWWRYGSTGRTGVGDGRGWGVQAVWVPGPAHRKIGRHDVSAFAGAGAWQLVLRYCGGRAAGPSWSGPPGRLPDPRRRSRRPRQPSRPRWPDGDCRGVDGGRLVAVLAGTDQRVEHWRQTGERFPVAVWASRHLAEFLRYVKDDRLSAMWWLIALRGLRRGEAAGPRWVDVDLDARVVMISQQRIAYGHTIAVGPPKTAASRRTIALDRHTVQLLRPPPPPTRRTAGSRACVAGLRYVFTTDLSAPCIPTGSPADSATSSKPPGCRRCGCTTCATALPASPTPLGPISRRCRSNSGTPASC